MANPVNLTKSDDKNVLNISDASVSVASKPLTSSLSKSVKSKFLKLPNGTGLIPTLICAFSAVDTGVSIKDRQGELIGFIEIEDYERQQQVLNLIEEIMTSGKRFVQPDWSFLN